MEKILSKVPAKMRKAIFNSEEARSFFLWRHVLSVQRVRCGVDQCLAMHRPQYYRKVSAVSYISSYIL
jgi:hypothetical protein